MTGNRIANKKILRIDRSSMRWERAIDEAMGDHNEHTGAIYLAGYLVECYLKWALCKRLMRHFCQRAGQPDLAGV